MEEFPEPMSYKEVPEHLKEKALTAFAFYDIIKFNYPDFDVPTVVNLR